MSLTTRVFHSIGWTSLSVVIVALLGLVQLGILARYLEPGAFGEAALARLVTSFAGVFASAGIADALIQRRALTAAQFSGLHLFNLTTGALAFGVVAFSAAPLASLLNAPILSALLPVAGVGLLVAPLGAMHQAMARKELGFRLIAIAEIAAAIMQFLVAVGSAVLFAQGVWSLVFGGLAGMSMMALIFFLRGNSSGFRLSSNVDWQSLPELVRFGLFRVGSGVLNLVRLRADQMIIGIAMGAQALGYYTVAVQIFELPLRQIPAVINKVMLPTFCLIQDDLARLRRGFLMLALVIASVISPIVFGIAAIAEDGVSLYLGEGWGATASVLQFIPVFVVLRSVAGAAGGVVVARGRADWAFYWSAVTLPLGVSVIWLLCMSGKLAVLAAGLSALQGLLFWGHWRFFLRRLIPLRFDDYARMIGTPLLMGFGMAVVVAALTAAMENYSQLGRLIVGVLVGVLLYVMGTLIFNRRFVALVRGRLLGAGAAIPYKE